MESKHTFFSKFLYSIEPRPEGGFIARSKDLNVPPEALITRLARFQIRHEKQDLWG